MADISALLDSPGYAAAVDELRRRTGITLYPDYPAPLQELDAKSVAAAAVPLDVLRRVLDSDRVGVVRFSLEKLRQFNGIVDVQDYPPDEEPDEADLPSTVERQGFSKGFLLINLLEYVLLRDRPDQLSAYLKAKRTPKARQYEAELRAVFDRARSASV